MTSDDELRHAGLYDPDAEDADEQIALLRYLVECGATIEDLVEGRDELPLVAATIALRVPGEQLTARQVAERSRVPEDVVCRVWRASGFPDPAPDDGVFSETDIDALWALHAAESLMGRDVVMQVIRVMGSSMARVAEGMVSAFVTNTTPAAGNDRLGLALAEASAKAVALLPEAIPFMERLFRRHAIAALRQPLAAGGGADRYESRPLAVGFADIVGSTAMAVRLSLRELGEAISEFEELTSELVVNAGGRVVKHIGDEVMFVVPDATVACEIGLAIASQIAAHPTLSNVRVGVAQGEVLSRYGDYFGPVVNLASRAVKVGPEGALVASQAVRAHLETRCPDRFQFDDLGSHLLAGFDRETSLFVVTRTP